jgi:hypothetical protein
MRRIWGFLDHAESSFEKIVRNLESSGFSLIDKNHLCLKLARKKAHPKTENPFQLSLFSTKIIS